MKLFLLMIFLLGEVSPNLQLAAAESDHGVTYYVKSSTITKCPGQPCETLNDYLDNMASELKVPLNCVGVRWGI